jgi:catechol 2,3-dioxygenase-like lactoylglutathione lyase family enzyme
MPAVAPVTSAVGMAINLEPGGMHDDVVVTVRLRNITIDCADPATVAGFWSQVTGFREDPDNPNLPGDDEWLLLGPAGSPRLLFIRVPEGKSGKNRLHLDVQPTERTRDEEVDWLLGLGAQVSADHRKPDGTGWVTLADPEGNEFCVERSAAERGD